jgi:hypothetical protein
MDPTITDIIAIKYKKSENNKGVKLYYNINRPNLGTSAIHKTIGVGI